MFLVFPALGSYFFKRLMILNGSPTVSMIMNIAIRNPGDNHFSLSVTNSAQATTTIISMRNTIPVI